MTINNQTKINLVIGYPLAHTQSPSLHNAVYKKLKLNHVLLACPHPQLKSLLQMIRTLSVGLTAVTIPYKEKVLKYLDKCSPEVKALKAANTLIQRKGKLIGYNTDVNGIAFALRKTKLKGKSILIIGAGGAARALGYYLQTQQAQLYWLNRTSARARRLASQFGGTVVRRDQLKTLPLDVIINTTPMGMYPHAKVNALPKYRFKPQQTVFDMVYNPVKTALLAQAEKDKAKTISGMEMFIGQALQQIELLTGKTIASPKLTQQLKNILLKHQRGVRS